MTRFYTTAEAAELLGLDVSRVRQFCAQGRLGEKIGRNWAIPADELKAFARQKRPAGNPDLRKKRKR